MIALRVNHLFGQLLGSNLDFLEANYIGIFSLKHLQNDEVILFDDDKHLLVQLSVVKHTVNGKPMVSLSTVVHIHNRLGRFYMAIVGPAHSFIVPRMLAQVTYA